ncbi:MAG: prolipoprotein diacylglyceryl transferase [Alphaproteobacteria bacterium]
MLQYPFIDPIALSIGPIDIRWYALAYLFGLILGWLYARRMARKMPHVITVDQLDDLLSWIAMGVIIGGRLGYVLFYNAPYYVEHPWEIVMVWKGGMAFHGGLAGVILAIIFYCKRHQLDPFMVGDLIAPTAPIGLFFGRLANFINGELYGRLYDGYWAVGFPSGANGAIEMRHPSQLYEAALEGILLFAVLIILQLWGGQKRVGLLTGVFLIGYGLSRITAEFFREPDPQLGFLLLGEGGLTMGMLLSLPMVLLGILFIMLLPRQYRHRF